jgi:hypothetical protein
MPNVYSEASLYFSKMSVITLLRYLIADAETVLWWVQSLSVEIRRPFTIVYLWLILILSFPILVNLNLTKGFPTNILWIDFSSCVLHDPSHPPWLKTSYKLHVKNTNFEDYCNVDLFFFTVLLHLLVSFKKTKLQQKWTYTHVAYRLHII